NYVSRSPFGNVRTATWETSTIVLKSIIINACQIDSGIIDEIKNAVNDSKIVPIETTISNNKTIITNAIRLFINEKVSFVSSCIEIKFSLIGLVKLAGTNSTNWVNVFNVSSNAGVYAYGNGLIQVLFAYEGWNNIN
ncbi:25309_t:CDS:2, partial [Dentiscutata erythropus]